MVRHPSATTRAALTGMTYVLLIVPETVIGVSLLQFYAASGIRLSFATLVAGVSPLAIAVTALIVRAGALTLDRRLGRSGRRSRRRADAPHLVDCAAASRARRARRAR